MTTKDVYRQKKQAQLDEWRNGVADLKAQAVEAGSDVKVAMHHQIDVLEGSIEHGKEKLAELASAGEDSWESLKDGVEASWDSMKSAARRAADRFERSEDRAIYLPVLAAVGALLVGGLILTIVRRRR